MTQEAQRAEERQDWEELLVKHTDIFQNSYCGYWLRGVDHTRNMGWLVREDDEAPDDEALDEWATRAWRRGEELPEGFYRIGVAVAEATWELGAKKWGEDWWEDADADSYDYVIQMTLLGEERYG